MSGNTDREARRIWKALNYAYHYGIQNVSLKTTLARLGTTQKSGAGKLGKEDNRGVVSTEDTSIR